MSYDLADLDLLPEADPVAVSDLADQGLMPCVSTCLVTCFWTCGFTEW